MRKRLANKLRKWAELLDRPGTMKKTSMSFYFKDGVGIFVDMTGRLGCPLWYKNDDDYERAHNVYQDSDGSSHEDERTAR